ncbi:hypothetical protein LPJ70_003915 [Coemansia sp. RSA 2708]|nr:hypothetical protein LPJ70_003915 [Coemansia sp. RSA 2708]
MLKAFSKVFHKSQDADEARVAGDDGAAGPRRVLERQRAGDVGAGAAGGAGEARRSGGGGYPRSPALDVGMRAGKEAGRRAGLAQRKEQALAPRLHLRGPAQGVDGRFPLTSDNIEWHMRMLPPMKESKYERILRYVQDQQQHVPAAVDPAPQQHDIEASVLMGGLAHDFVVKPFHSQLHPLTHNGAAYGAAAGMAVLAPPRAGGFHAPRAPGLAPNGQAATHATTHRADNEEDDNTPLAAINMASRPRSMDVGGLEKYAAPLDDPLPGPGSPAYGARMSMLSFHSNVAVQLNSDANERLSRSLSASNPVSANDQAVPDAHAASQGLNRPSLDAITPTAQEFAPGIAAADGQAGDSDRESQPGVELRVVNHASSSGSSSSGSDDDDDNRPLVSLGRRLSKTHEPLHVDAAATPAENAADDDDDQPLSALLFPPHSASDELGGLPLPMPRHVTDPDLAAPADEAVPLSRSYTPGATKDTGDEPAAAARRRSNLRYSTPLSPLEPGFNSLPRPSKTGAIAQMARADEDTAGRPWLASRQYSASTASVNSRKHAHRGSTLGQQLTEELQRVREDIARTRRDSERGDRRSWQVGDPPPAQQPWANRDSALSESALPAALPPAASNPLPCRHYDDAHSDAPKLPSSWSYSDKPRPLSTQNYRLSRWFGRPLKPDSSSADAIPAASASQPIPASLSSRLNGKLARLKRSFKPASNL